MTMKEGTPEPSRAWKIADSLTVLAKEEDRPLARLYNNLLVAAVLARGGQADSARHLAKYSRGNEEIDKDRELALLGAFVATLVGDKSEAIDLLKTYLTANPGRREQLADDSGWWFRPLDGETGYLQLIGRKP